MFEMQLMNWSTLSGYMRMFLQNNAVLAAISLHWFSKPGMHSDTTVGLPSAGMQPPAEQQAETVQLLQGFFLQQKKRKGKQFVLVMDYYYEKNWITWIAVESDVLYFLLQQQKSNLTTVIESKFLWTLVVKHVYFSCKIWHFNMVSYGDNLEPASSGF